MLTHGRTSLADASVLDLHKNILPLHLANAVRELRLCVRSVPSMDSMLTVECQVEWIAGSRTRRLRFC